MSVVLKVEQTHTYEIQNMEVSGNNKVLNSFGSNAKRLFHNKLLGIIIHDQTGV